MEDLRPEAKIVSVKSVPAAMAAVAPYLDEAEAARAAQELIQYLAPPDARTKSAAAGTLAALAPRLSPADSEAAARRLLPTLKPVPKN